MSGEDLPGKSGLASPAPAMSPMARGSVASSIAASTGMAAEVKASIDLGTVRPRLSSTNIFMFL
jgi:hypothetical protein